MKIVNYSKKGMEVHGRVMRFVRIFTVPLLNHIPSSLLRLIMKKSSRDAEKVLKNVGYASALEVVYTRHHRKLLDRGFFQGVADFFWHHCTSQAKALRNRLKIVEDILESEIVGIASSQSEKISILTVGGGSARAIIHGLSRITKKYPGLSMQVTNIDKDANAISLGKKIAREHGLENIFHWKNDSASNIQKMVPPNSIDIVEMVGLLDYFSDQKGIRVFKLITDVLKPGGKFIVANVHPNNEQRFLHNMGWPDMYYRNPEMLKNLLHDGGFTKEPLIIFEPLKLHIIAIVEK